MTAGPIYTPGTWLDEVTGVTPPKPDPEARTYWCMGTPDKPHDEVRSLYDRCWLCGVKARLVALTPPDRRVPEWVCPHHENRSTCPICRGEAPAEGAQR